MIRHVVGGKTKKDRKWKEKEKEKRKGMTSCFGFDTWTTPRGNSWNLTVEGKVKEREKQRDADSVCVCVCVRGRECERDADKGSMHSGQIFTCWVTFCIKLMDNWWKAFIPMSIGTLGLKWIASFVPNDDELDKTSQNYMSEIAKDWYRGILFCRYHHSTSLLHEVENNCSEKWFYLLLRGLFSCSAAFSLCFLCS